MTDTTPRLRTGGRAGRQAARASHHIERVPFLTRTLKPFEVLDEEGLAIDRGERRHDPRGGRARVPRRPGRARAFRDAGADVQGERVRFPRGMCRQIVQATAPREFTQYARNEANSVQIGGTAHRPRPELRLAVRPRPGQRPALRHDRGLPELREARLHAPAPPPQRRDGLRAGRRAGQQAPPRHGLFAHPLQRQAVHGLGDRAGAGARHRRDGADHVRRRLPRGPRGDPVADQRQLAARLGRDDARRGAGLRRGEPGDAADAVHPRRRDGAGDRRRGLRPDARRGARRDDVRPARPARRAGRPRVASRARCRCSRARPTFGTPEPALVLYAMAALARRLGVPFRSGGNLCASKIADAQAAYEIGGDVQPDDPRRRQLRPPRRRLARGRARRRLREVHPRRRPVRDGRGVRQGRRHVARTARRSTRSSRTARASTSSARAHTLANFETAFYRSEIADNNSFEQWQEDGALDAAQRANAIWKRMLAEYEAPPLDPGIDEALLEFIARRKAALPDSEV